MVLSKIQIFSRKNDEIKEKDVEIFSSGIKLQTQMSIYRTKML